MHADKITILDGAMGTALRARGVLIPDYKSSIWSALALLDAPDEIRRLHEDYIAAGADIITVNNYAVTRTLLARENIEHRLGELTLTATRLAIEARHNANADRCVAIAGSLGPLNTTYRVDLVGSFDENLKAYRETATMLAPHVDLLICETMATAQEARAAAMAGAQTGKPVWVSWTLSPDGKSIRSGESTKEALAALHGLPVAAVLLNCSAGDAVQKALPELVRTTTLAVGVYSNPVHHEPAGGEPQTVPDSPLDPDEYANMAADWIQAGARIIGGCCDTRPAHIAKLRALVS